MFELRPEIFMPFEQHPGPATAMTIVARAGTPDALATLAACYVPIRRAVRVDPMIALRAE